MPGNTKTIKRSGRKSIPVWAWFSSDWAGTLQHINGRLTGEKYFSILEDVLLPSAWEKFGTDALIPFVQDRSAIHTSTIVTDWFDEEGVSFDVLPWPPKGADMKLIKNVWAEMVRDMDSQHATANELLNSVNNIWGNLSRRPNYWRILSNSMAKRLAMVIDVDGDWTKY
jgi:hypothetical protein